MGMPVVWSLTHSVLYVWMVGNPGSVPLGGGQVCQRSDPHPPMMVSFIWPTGPPRPVPLRKPLPTCLPVREFLKKI